MGIPFFLALKCGLQEGGSLWVLSDALQNHPGIDRIWNWTILNFRIETCRNGRYFWISISIVCDLYVQSVSFCW